MIQWNLFLSGGINASSEVFIVNFFCLNGASEKHWNIPPSFAMKYLKNENWNIEIFKICFWKSNHSDGKIQTLGIWTWCLCVRVYFRGPSWLEGLDYKRLFLKVPKPSATLSESPKQMLMIAYMLIYTFIFDFEQVLLRRGKEDIGNYLKMESFASALNGF